MGSYHNSKDLDGLIYSVFSKRLTVSQFWDTDNKIQTIYQKLTELYRLNTMVGSLRYLITLLKYTLLFYIVKLGPTFLHC